MKRILVFGLLLLALSGCTVVTNVTRSDEPGIYDSRSEPAKPKLTTTDAEWKGKLTEDQYHILREEGTEPAFHNAYFDKHDAGDYYCAACGQKLFSSKEKFDSGTGWPSFTAPVKESAVLYREDDSFGERTKVLCSNCGGHLGHVFDDGPKPTGKRFCMNSGALKFVASAPGEEWQAGDKGQRNKP